MGDCAIASNQKPIGMVTEIPKKLFRVETMDKQHKLTNGMHNLLIPYLQGHRGTRAFENTFVMRIDTSADTNQKFKVVLDVDEAQDLMDIGTGARTGFPGKSACMTLENVKRIGTKRNIASHKAYHMFILPMSEIPVDYKIYYVLSISRYGPETIKRLVEHNKYINHPSLNTKVFSVSSNATISDWRPVMSILRLLDEAPEVKDVSNWKEVSDYLDAQLKLT